MNRIFSSVKSIIAVLVIASALVSCSKAPEQANLIPKEANIVLAVDVKSLGLKSMDFKEILSLDNIKKVVSGEKAKDSTVEKLKNSGVNLLSSAYLFVNVVENDKGNGGMLFEVSDGEKFEKFILGLNKKFTVTSEGDVKVAISAEDNKGVIVWNKGTGLVYFQKDSDGSNPKDKALAILNLKKEESLASSNENFKEFLKQGGDISLWVDAAKFGKLAQSYNPGALPVDLKDTYFSAICNFENGQVVVNTKYHANQEISQKLNLGKDNLSKELASVVPGKSLVALLGFALDMNKTYEYLNNQNLIAGIEPNIQGMTGLSAKEVFQIFNGEVAATLNGFEMKDMPSYNFETQQEEMKKVPNPVYSVVLGINDKDKAATLLNTLATRGMIQKTDKSYSVMGQYTIIDKGSYIVFTTESLKQEVIDGKDEKLNAEMASLLTQNSAALYLSANNISEETLASFGTSVNDWIKKSPIESLTITSSPLKDQVSTGKFVLAMKNKDQNSLVSLAKMSDDLASKTQQMEPAIVTDSLAVEEPAVVDAE